MMRGYFVVVLTVVAICLSTNGVTAHNGRDHGAKVDPRPSSGGGGPNIRRVLDIDTNQHEVEIEARSTTAGIQTSYHFEFKTDGVARWRSRFFQRTNDTATMYAFKVVVLKIVEFNDTGSVVGQFDRNDTITNSIRLSDGSGSNWDTIRSWQTIGSDGVSKVVNWNTRRELPNSAYLNITFRTAENLVTDLQSGATVSPKGIKFDVDLENYLFQTACDSVALVLAIKSKDSRKLQELDHTVGVVPIGTHGGLSWTTDIARGTNSSILLPSTISSSALMSPATGEADDNDDDSGETAQLLYFSVPSGDLNARLNLKWDPVFAVDTVSESSAGSVIASFTLLVLTCLVGVSGSLFV